MPDPDTISADYTLRPSELAATLALLVEVRQPVILWGAPGSAKSAVAQQVAADAARQYVDVRALLLDPVDLRGIPWRDSADRTRWAPPAFLPPTDDPGRWLINLEELPSAVPMVQAALYQLVLDRKVGEYELPEGASLIACGIAPTEPGGETNVVSEQLDRRAFLDGAVHAEPWRGLAFGVFRDRHRGYNDPDLNFHGLTLPVRLPTLESVHAGIWSVRADIGDCPELELVLPARKEAVENDFLKEMRDAARLAIYDWYDGLDRVDMGRAVLRVEDTKSGEPLEFPVTRQLAAILDRRLAERERFAAKTRGWVFPSETSGSGHLEGMQHLNARIGEAGGSKFWFHALRNCFISVADRDLMLPASLTKRLVNHSRPQDVTEGYAADWTMEQLRDAAQRIADKIDELIRAGRPAPAARAA